MKEKTVAKKVAVTVADYTIVDLATKEVKEGKVELLAPFKNEDKLIKAVKELVETDNIKVIMIDSYGVFDKTYSMPLELFVKYATSSNYEETDKSKDNKEMKEVK